MRVSAFILLLVLCSCSIEQRIENREQRALRKIKKLALKYPGILQTNTITDTVRVIVPSVRADTTVITSPIDTFWIEKERVRTRVIRNHDTITVHSECLGDTVFVERKIPVERIRVEKERLAPAVFRWLRKSLWFVIVILVLGVGYKLLRLLK